MKFNVQINKREASDLKYFEKTKCTLQCTIKEFLENLLLLKTTYHTLKCMYV